MQDLYEFFNYTDGLTPEVYFKYIIFVSVVTVISRLIGEMLNSVK